MPWLREDPEYLRKPFFSTFALVCEQSPFLVFDKLSSAAEDHTPASCRPRQKGDHHFDLDMPGTFSRLHQRSPDSRGIVSFVLCVPVAPQNPKRLRRLLSRAICITETAFLYCNNNGAGPSCARPQEGAMLPGLCSSIRSIRAHGSRNRSRSLLQRCRDLVLLVADSRRGSRNTERPHNDVVTREYR